MEHVSKPAKKVLTDAIRKREQRQANRLKEIRAICFELLGQEKVHSCHFELLRMYELAGRK